MGRLNKPISLYQDGEIKKDCMNFQNLPRKRNKRK